MITTGSTTTTGDRWAASDTLPYWGNTLEIRIFFILSSNDTEESILGVNIFDLHCRLALSSSRFRMVVHTFVLFVVSAGLLQRRKEALLATKMRSCSFQCGGAFLLWRKC